MSTAKNSLSANETIVFEGKLHWWVFVKGALFILAGLLIFSSIGTLLYLCLGIGIALIVIAYLQYSSSEFIVTDKRVVLKTGIISRHFADIPLKRADGLIVNESLIGRILGFGSVSVTTAGQIQWFKPLAGAMEFRQQVTLAMEKYSS
ncbi:PH domain-containing protein [Sphingobacteriales bacterium UPWRP_1]|nr:hypothetical protein BVG80_15240 [Sphingobacteriales bacterium TSM_CSM]PSJ79101.1 PH domain-containing protein [Sphingobacteriales bacterium UPWRP_1]